MNKKAQVTIFVIIAIVIVAAIMIFFAARNSTFLISNKIPQEIFPINDFVIGCIEKSGYGALYTMGQQGGYLIPSSRSLEFGVPYYIFDDENLIPSKEKIEREISEHINGELFFCISNFRDFPSFEIEQREVNVMVEIKDEEVILDVNYPLSIRKGDASYLLENFEDIKIPIRLGLIYNISNEIVQENIGKESICLSCLINQGIENNLSINMFNYNENTTVMVILDENSKINNEPYEFKFAIKS